MAIKSIKIESLKARTLLLVAAAVLVGGNYYIVKWSFANMASVRAVEPEIAALTTRLAPADPQTHFASAVVYDKTFNSEDQLRSLTEYEIATALSPNNYLVWLELGKARSRSGDADGAEKALRKAAELAPNYSVVQWTLGNELLRQGNDVEGFVEIQKAVVGNSIYAAPAVTTAWQIFGGDIDRVNSLIGDSTQMRSAFAVLLGRQKRYDEAAEIWNLLPADEKRTSFAEAGKALFGQLIEAKKFRAARNVLDSMSGADQAGIAAEQIRDGGFENEIKLQNAPPFEWQISDGAQPQVAFSDGQKHGGDRSLIAVFNSADGKQMRTISQIVAVEPGINYTFEAFYRSELKAAGKLKWEITDASNGKLLAATAPVIPNTDWAGLTTRFTIPPNSDGVIVRLVLENCGSIICPISGKIWFDDLTIKAQ